MTSTRNSKKRSEYLVARYKSGMGILDAIINRYPAWGQQNEAARLRLEETAEEDH